MRGGWRRGRELEESNSHCMLVPTGLDFKLQKLVSIISMLLNVFSAPKVCLKITEDKKQGGFKLN